MYSVEWNKDFENIDLYADISQVTAQDILDLVKYVTDIVYEKFGKKIELEVKILGEN